MHTLEGGSSAVMKTANLVGWTKIVSGSLSINPVPLRDVLATELSMLKNPKDKLIGPFTNFCLASWGYNRAPEGERSDAAETFQQVLKRPWMCRDGDGKEVLDTPLSLRYTPSQERMVKYLGFENEDQFKIGARNNIVTMVRDTMTNEGGHESFGLEEAVTRINDILSFAEQAYSTRAPRKSGESYYCHTLRTLYYTVDRLYRTHTLPRSLKDIIDIVSIAALHDAKEDVKDLETIPVVPSREYPFKQRTDYTYRIPSRDTEGNAQTYHRLPVSHRAHNSIIAMTSPEMDTDGMKFEKVVSESPWSITEIIKNMDRVDNVLTYRFSAKSWWAYIYKMNESAVGLAALSSGSDVAHLIKETVPSMFSHIYNRKSDMEALGDHRLPGFELSYALMFSGFQRIRDEFFQTMFKKYGRHYKLSPHDPQLANKRPDAYTWDDEDLYPDIGKTLDLATREGRTLNTSDLCTYEDNFSKRQDTYMNSGPRRVGYGQVYKRPISQNERRTFAVRKGMESASTISMLVALGATTTAFFEHVLHNNHDLTKETLQIVLNLILLTGGLQVGSRIANSIANTLERHEIIPPRLHL